VRFFVSQILKPNLLLREQFGVDCEYRWDPAKGLALEGSL
jgi:hypothetical protein